MKKKAFTLIELLVVIAIIAILAAILFPVFARAKSAAKKATAISGIKQMGAATLMYMSDYDDMYPRQDDCVDKSSLNKTLNTNAYNYGTCVSGPFYYRTNHYSWQKWLMPYAKSVDIFIHPAMQKDDASWSRDGEIFNGYAINLALTGALNTVGRTPADPGFLRNSFLGGNQNAIPDQGAALLFMELASTSINFMPTFVTPNAGTQTAYPPAIREMLKPLFMKRISSPCNYSEDTDDSLYPFGGIINIGRTDGSAKSIAIKKFLADTPPAAEYAVSSRWPCAPTGGAWTISAAPTWNKSWPMWALEK